METQAACGVKGTLGESKTTQVENEHSITIQRTCHLKKKKLLDFKFIS